jgi:hypothetical protein
MALSWRLPTADDRARGRHHDGSSVGLQFLDTCIGALERLVLQAPDRPGRSRDLFRVYF